MNTGRFDAWTRALARGLPRRTALKTVAGTVVAGLAVRATQRGAAACTATAGAPCDPQFGCCADLGLVCGAGTCEVVGSPGCPILDPNTNKCVNTPICEGQGCKKKKKKRKKRKH